jgi:hypothetical protein
MAPGKNNARSMSHSETGKARRGYPEKNKAKKMDRHAALAMT